MNLCARVGKETCLEGWEHVGRDRLMPALPRPSDPALLCTSQAAIRNGQPNHQAGRSATMFAARCQYAQRQRPANGKTTNIMWASNPEIVFSIQRTLTRNKSQNTWFSDGIALDAIKWKLRYVTNPPPLRAHQIHPSKRGLHIPKSWHNSGLDASHDSWFSFG